MKKEYAIKPFLTTIICFLLFGFSSAQTAHMTSFSPTSQKVSQYVDITGTNLLQVNEIYFGKVKSDTITGNNESLHVIVPRNAGKTIYAYGAGHVLLDSIGEFTYVDGAVPPTIFSFDPKQGGPGSVINISGVNFYGVTGVKFGGKPAASFHVISSMFLQATLDSGSSGFVSVTNTDGIDSLGRFVYSSNGNTVPKITSFTPEAAGAGDTVIIQGTDLDYVARVTFGGIPADDFALASPTRLATKVGKGNSGNVSVQNVDGDNTYLPGFTYIGPPVISSFNPAAASLDSVVLIKGTNFSGVINVYFGNNPARTFELVDAGTLRAVVDTGSSGDVKVVTKYGRDSLPGFVYNNPTSKITLFSPMEGGMRDSIRIYGRFLDKVTQVSFGGHPALDFKKISAQEIVARVEFGASGDVKIIGTWGTDSMPGFIYIDSPKITSYSPALGGKNTVITIIGENFKNVGRVSFGTIDALSYEVVSPTLITAVVNTGKSGDVVVSNRYGTAYAHGFTFVPAPKVLSFSPMNARLDSTVVIKGKNFAMTAKVSFGGKFINTFTVVNDSVINAVLTDAGESGYVRVETPGGSDSIQQFRIAEPPKIFSFSPDTAGGGEFVTIIGKYMRNASSVSFGGINSTSYRNGPDTIMARVGEGASGVIKVVTDFGEDSIVGFHYRDLPPVLSPMFYAGGPGQQVTLQGINLAQTTSVSIGGYPVKSFTVLSATAVSVIVGRGGAGLIKLTTPYGVDSIQPFVFYTPTPVMTSFSPKSGGIGTQLSIKGTDLDYITGLWIGNKNAWSSSKINSDTLITVTIDTNYHGFITIHFETIRSQKSEDEFTFAQDIEPLVAASGANPVSGDVSTKMTYDSTVQTYNNSPYVQRHYDIEPTVNPSTSTATVTLYFMQEDFNNYNRFPNHGNDLPANPEDAAGIANLRIYQYHGFSANGEPGTYNGEGVEIDPDDSKIVWNQITELWEVTFDVSGFSGFFIGSVGSDILPLKLLSFTGNSKNNGVNLTWTTASEVNVNRFEVEKSGDGRQYGKLAAVKATGGRSETNYSYLDNSEAASFVNFYRLKIIDNDGKFSYSKVIKVVVEKNAAIVLYPNPAKARVTIVHPFTDQNIQIKLIDASGKVVEISVSKGVAETTIDLSGMAKGIYHIVWSNGKATYTKALLVQ